MNKIIFVFLLLTILGYSVSVTNTEPSTNEQIKATIYPTGTSSETYYFMLNVNGELIVEKGSRVGDNIIQIPFIKDVKEREKKLLSFSETSNLIDLINKVYEVDYSTDNVMVEDSWYVQILYKEKIVKQNYWYDISPQVKDLIDELISISPIEVDLHGWS